MSTGGSDIGTFWDHLDELRSCIIRVILVTVVLAMIAFAFKSTLFDVVLAPSRSDFISYRILGVEPFTIRLMNTGLTEQFMIHIKVSCYCGLLFACPPPFMPMSDDQPSLLLAVPTSCSCWAQPSITSSFFLLP